MMPWSIALQLVAVVYRSSTNRHPHEVLCSTLCVANKSGRAYTRSTPKCPILLVCLLSAFYHNISGRKKLSFSSSVCKILYSTFPPKNTIWWSLSDYAGPLELRSRTSSNQYGVSMTQCMVLFLCLPNNKTSDQNFPPTLPHKSSSFF